MPTIIATEVPLNTGQIAQLDKLFSSPEYELLLKVIAAKSIKAQVSAMNVMLYAATNDRASEDEKLLRAEASQYNNALDLLDQLGQNREEWATVDIKQSH